MTGNLTKNVKNGQKRDVFQAFWGLKLGWTWTRRVNLPFIEGPTYVWGQKTDEKAFLDKIWHENLTKIWPKKWKTDKNGTFFRPFEAYNGIGHGPDWLGMALRGPLSPFWGSALCLGPLRPKKSKYSLSKDVQNFEDFEPKNLTKRTKTGLKIAL